MQLCSSSQAAGKIMQDRLVAVGVCSSLADHHLQRLQYENDFKYLYEHTEGPCTAWETQSVLLIQGWVGQQLAASRLVGAAAARRAAHHEDALCHFLVLYGLCVAQNRPNEEQAQQEGHTSELHLAWRWFKLLLRCSRSRNQGRRSQCACVGQQLPLIVKLSRVKQTRAARATRPQFPLNLLQNQPVNARGYKDSPSPPHQPTTTARNPAADMQAPTPRQQ